MPTRKKTKAQKQAQYERIMNRLNANDTPAFKGPEQLRREGGALETATNAYRNEFSDPIYNRMPKRRRTQKNIASMFETIDNERKRLSDMATKAAKRMGLNTNLKRVSDPSTIFGDRSPKGDFPTDRLVAVAAGGKG